MSTIVGFKELLPRLFDAFPPRSFQGLVSRHDECSEGIELRRELLGKRWDEVSADIVDNNASALALLEPDALVAFLPAWLLRSIERFDDENLVLAFTLYFLCPGNEDEGWDLEEIAKLVNFFNDRQRSVVCAILRAIVENKDLSGYKADAEHGLKWWCT